jgi:ribonuclease P protein component
MHRSAGRYACGWVQIGKFLSPLPPSHILIAMHLLRLSGRKTCDRVQRQGTVWKGKTFIARWLPGAPRNLSVPPKRAAIYLGTYASAALDASAVRRNRMRRRVREALRLGIDAAPETPTIQLLVSPRSASLDAPFPVLQEDVMSFLRTLSTWHNRNAASGASSSSH